MSIQAEWENIKQIIKNEYGLSDIAYNTWIEPLQFQSEDNNKVTITIPSDKAHALNYISSKYSSFFEVTISERMNATYTVNFVLEKTINKEENNLKTDREADNNYYRNVENANLNPKYVFDTFVVGKNNQFAHSASLAVAESPGNVYNPLFLYGGAGLGKTHLMHSIGHYILQTNKNMKVLYVTSEEFTNELIESLRSGNNAAMSKLRDKYRNVDVLMVDDVQFIIGKDATQEEFFNTFNALHSTGKQIILSSDKPPKEMETLDERFRSRFEWGLTADIQQPDYETRMAILRKNSENYEEKVDDSIIQYIAENIISNIRELEGAFNKIIAYSKIKNVEITLPMAQEALKDVIYPSHPKTITIDFILKTVCEHYGIKVEDVKSKKRNAEIVVPRQVYMYLCRDLTDISLSSIADYINRDHTTAMHGVEKVEKLLEKDEDFVHNIESIKKKINPNL